MLNQYQPNVIDIVSEECVYICYYMKLLIAALGLTIQANTILDRI